MAVFAGDPLPEFGGMSHAYGATACETNANRVRSVVIEAPHCKELVDAGPMSLRRLEADEAGLRKLPIHGEKAGRGPSVGRRRRRVWVKTRVAPVMPKPSPARPSKYHV